MPNHLMHTINLDITGFSPNYIKIIELPVIATRIVGVSAFAPETLDDSHNYLIELVLNDDRNHIVLPISPTGTSGENRSGMVPVNCQLDINAEHMIILRNINKCVLTLKLKTCQDEQA